MDSEQNILEEQPRLSAFIWSLVFVSGLLLSCFGISTLTYFLMVPSWYDLRVGFDLPDSAKVINEIHHQSSMGDWTYQLAIRFEDDAARDLFTHTWSLQHGEAKNSVSNDLDWWPQDRIDEIEESEEQYGRTDDQPNRSWSLWIDRENNLLYLELTKS